MMGQASFTASSIGTGGTFSPPAVMISSGKQSGLDYCLRLPFSFLHNLKWLHSTSVVTQIQCWVCPNIWRRQWTRKTPARLWELRLRCANEQPCKSCSNAPQMVAAWEHGVCSMSTSAHDHITSGCREFNQLVQKLKPKICWGRAEFVKPRMKQSWAFPGCLLQVSESSPFAQPFISCSWLEPFMKLDLFGVGQELLLLQAIFTTALSFVFSYRLTSKASWNWREPAGHTRQQSCWGNQSISALLCWHTLVSEVILPPSQACHVLAGSTPCSHIQIKIFTRRSISIFSCAIHSHKTTRALMHPTPALRDPETEEWQGALPLILPVM